jgi:hypothetical protein
MVHDQHKELAQTGFSNIRQAILGVLGENPQGLGNSEIAEILGLRTGIDGRQTDYLTWSILQDLVQQKVLKRVPRPNSKRQHLYQTRT